MWIRRKKFDELQKTLDKLTYDLSKVNNLSFVIGIERKGRENIFTFIRNNKVIEIKTMGLISDDLPKWKEELLR